MAAPTKKQLQYPTHNANAVVLKTFADAVEAARAAGTLAGNALPASTAGRALMETGYFLEATATDKFAAGAIDASVLLKDDTVTQAKLAPVLFGSPSTRSGAGAIAITAPVALYTSTGVSQALTVADGTVDGHRLRIVHTVDGGSGIITQTTGAKLSAGVATITFTNRFDWVELMWNSTLWEIVGYSGATIA
jgi:hypothetical protein